MSTNTKELALNKNYDISKMAEAKNMAVALKDYIVEQNLYTPIQGKNYVNVEGWMVAGGLMGMTAKIVKVENLSTDKERKWRADVEIVRLKDDVSVGFGSAICSNLEGKKKSFDEYAICSMAQTRAIGKAYRNMIGWVIKLAGYEAAPAEEMAKAGEDTPKTPEIAKSDASALVDARVILFDVAVDLGAKAGNEKQFIETKLKKRIAWTKLTVKHYGMLKTELMAKIK